MRRLLLLLSTLITASQGAFAFELAQGVIVDGTRSRAYLMNPEGGIDAVALSNGAMLATTARGAKPLLLDDGALLAQAEGERGGAEPRQSEDARSRTRVHGRRAASRRSSGAGKRSSRPFLSGKRPHRPQYDPRAMAVHATHNHCRAHERTRACPHGICSHRPERRAADRVWGG